MEFNHDLTLHSEKPTGQYDADGNPIIQKINNTILCAEGVVSRSEYYQASSVGLKAQAVLYVNPDDYSGEKTATFMDNTHTVERVYPYEDGGIKYLELTLTDRLGD